MAGASIFLAAASAVLADPAPAPRATAQAVARAAIVSPARLAIGEMSPPRVITPGMTPEARRTMRPCPADDDRPCPAIIFDLP